MTVPQTTSLKGLTAKGNDYGMDGVVLDRCAVRDRASWFESPRHLLVDGFVAGAGNERRGGDYESDENQGNH
jgi:hypothetical protein